MSRVKILLTNAALSARGGSELYLRDVATELLKRGHTPIVYSTLLGEVARELRAATIPVIDDLNDMSVAPDVIHGQHQAETMTALLHFPGVPAVQFCHGWSHWEETPVRFPRIRRYVAVDQTCRDRLTFQHGIPEERIRVLLNFVDLRRFQQRTTPLPPRPSRALVFSNYANEATHLPAVREACARANIKLDVMGSAVRMANSHPEQTLAEYDLVFAKARCALESLVVGAAVILCDAGGLGPMVSVANLGQLRPMNFGIRALREPLQPELIVREINRYDPADAATVSKVLRETAGPESVVDELVELYEEVIAENDRCGPVDVSAESRAAAAYVRQLKIDLTAPDSTSYRLRQRLKRVPVLGALGVRLARIVRTP